MTFLDIMTDEEVQQVTPVDDVAGFGSLATERGHLPLKAMDVKAKVLGLVSHVTLRQTFVNTFDVPIEATYIFPLPDRGSVTSFRMEVNGRVIDGVIKERGQARQEYDAALRAGHRAAITEEERSGVFTVRVGNLMPSEEGTVWLTVTGPLPYTDGEATFRFPLVVAPRYIPGSPLPGDTAGDGVAVDTDVVPDASRITPPVLLPGFPNPMQLSLEVEFDLLGMPLSRSRRPTGKLRSALSGLVGGGKAPEVLKAPAEAEALDLSSYRRRAKSMLDKAGHSGGNSRALGVLAVDLRRLVEDLESVGADDSIITPLRELAAKLHHRSGRDDQELWAKAALEAFVESCDAAPQPRKKFWKTTNYCELVEPAADHDHSHGWSIRCQGGCGVVAE